MKVRSPHSSAQNAPVVPMSLRVNDNMFCTIWPLITSLTSSSYSPLLSFIPLLHSVSLLFVEYSRPVLSQSPRTSESHVRIAPPTLRGLLIFRAVLSISFATLSKTAIYTLHSNPQVPSLLPALFFSLALINILFSLLIVCRV